MRLPFALMVASALVACAPTVPESGVGFDDYATYMSQREAALASGGAAPSAPPVFSTGRVEAALDNAEAGATTSTLPPVGQQPLVATDANRPRGNAPAGIREENGEMARMSDEQNFDAVAARESIASNAERLAEQRAQYQVVAPKALPQRSGPSEPNIVAFALATTHAPGTPVYRRGGLFTPNATTACARYTSPDLAQEAFLAAGGPDKDRKGLDPDGDGFACGWDPRPFRTARP